MLALNKALQFGVRHVVTASCPPLYHHDVRTIHTIFAWASLRVCRHARSRSSSSEAYGSVDSRPQQASYVQGACATPLLGSTIGRNLAETAHRFPNTLAVCSVHQKARLTYTELYTAVRQTAQGLLAVGVRPGDRVAILSPNNIEWVTLMYATATMGAVLVPLNPSYTAAELQFALQHSRASMLVAASACKGVEMVKTVQAAAQPLMTPSRASDDDLLKHLLVLGAPSAGNLSWEDLQAASPATPTSLLAETEASLQFDAPAQIQYTSGTTGKPKGVTLSHHSLLNNGFFIGRGNHYTEHDKVCLPVPLFHCFGCVLGALAITSHGAAMVLPGEGFNPEQILAAVQQEQCTSLYGVPTMFIAELAHPRFASYDMSSLRKGIMAGSPCPEEIMEQVVQKMHMKEVTICYGMTETSPVSFQTSRTDPLHERVATIGRVHPHIEAKIIDPVTGQVLPRGTPGELCVRGYSVMLGYWDNAAATRQVVDQARWMHTGDIAVLADDGYCKIVGRLKDMIIRGGENISPRQVEEVIHQHPSVLDVQVIGVPDAKYGEEVCAWVRLQPNSTSTAADLAAWCEGRLAAFKVPHHWKFVESYPMTASGKVQKYLMRQQHMQEPMRTY